MLRRNATIKGFNILEIIIVIIVTSIISALTVGVIMSNNYRSSGGMSYQELLEDSNIKEFLDVYSKVLSEYYEDVDNGQVIDSAINGMMSYLGDKYSSYLDSSSTDALTTKLSGIYKGVGISIDASGVIVEVFEESPAFEAGLEVKDKIVKVNDHEITEEDINKINTYVNESDVVKIKVIRNDEYKEFEIKLEELYVPAIAVNTYEYNNKKIGYLYISTFSATLGDQVEKALYKLDGKIDSLIIDVRKNNGGYLIAATDTASLFLEKGKTIYSLEGKDGNKTYYDETERKTSYPIVVLVDGNTASAAEILAAALKDSYGAEIVGTTTYGKGKVQSTYKLDDGSMVKYTSAKWFRPNGSCIDEVGIEPDYNVELEVAENGYTQDSQFNKAVEVLSLK